MNRDQRRLQRAKAKEIGAKIARGCVDFQNGAPVTITDPRTIAVLRRAFTMALQQGRPLSVQISDDEASTFPNWRETSRGLSHILAVGFDVDGRGSYALRSAGASYRPDGLFEPLASAEAADNAARESLSEILVQSGYPGCQN